MYTNGPNEGLSVEIKAWYAIIYHRNIWYTRDKKRPWLARISYYIVSLWNLQVPHSNSLALQWFVRHRSYCTNNDLKLYLQPWRYLLAYLHKRLDKCLVGATLQIRISGYTVWCESLFFDVWKTVLNVLP